MNREPSEQKAIAAIEKAYTQEEIDAARKLLSRHLQMFPESGGADMGHILPYLEENAKQRSDDARRLGLRPAEAKTREGLLKQAASFRDPLSKETLSILGPLLSSLRSWARAYKDDIAVHQITQDIENEYELVVSLHQNNAAGG